MSAAVPIESPELAPRLVRGALFVDYVRMVRRQRQLEHPRLTAEDRELLVQRIEPMEWYPMAAFERMGLVILESLSVALRGADALDPPTVSLLTVSPEPIRFFGRHQIAQMVGQFPELVVARSPRETLMRFRVLLSSFFAFPAIEVLSINDTSAELTMDYGMSPAAERAACWQTLGFCEALLAMAGARHHHCELVPRPWDVVGKVTRLRLAWVDARRPRPSETGPADVPPAKLAQLQLVGRSPSLAAVEPEIIVEVEPMAPSDSAPIELTDDDRKDRL